ncbi:MAG: cobalamin-dependent protein [Actinobacteria bacterium]|nr:cobalamin-dependent protein [Actinomycetota bacterium]
MEKHDDSDSGKPVPAEERILIDRVAAALASHDKPAAVRTAVEAVTSGAISIAALYRDVLTPLLAHAGALWQHGKLAIWEEHLASATVRTVVEILYPGVLKAKAAVPPAGRSVLLASPPEEGHDLGLRMISDRFDMAGWTTYFLGADTPVDEVADAALRLGVDALVLSSSTHYHRVALRRHVDHFKRELPGVDVWVGGPAFAHDTNAWAASELLDLEALLGEPPLPGGEDV